MTFTGLDVCYDFKEHTLNSTLGHDTVRELYILNEGGK